MFIGEASINVIADSFSDLMRASPATAALTTILNTRFAGASPEQVLQTADPQVMSTLRTMVNDVLGTTQSPRYDQPARALPASDTPTDRGGIQLTTLAQRDAQGRLQVQLNNGQPRWVSAVRSYSDDGVTWTTPAAENGTFGVMLGAGTAAGQSMQSPVATIPLSPAPYVRIKTFGIGTDLAGAYADPDSRFLLGAVSAQGIASIAIPALEPVLATNALHTGGLTWGSGDAGTMQTWVTAMMPCFSDPTIQAAIQAGIVAQNMNEPFRLLYSCAMRIGVNLPSVLQGLLSAAGMGNRTAPQALTQMFNVLSNLGTGVEGAFNTTAIRSRNALNVFDVVDPTRFMSVTSVAPADWIKRRRHRHHDHRDELPDYTGADGDRWRRGSHQCRSRLRHATHRRDGRPRGRAGRRRGLGSGLAHRHLHRLLHLHLGRRHLHLGHVSLR